MDQSSMKRNHFVVVASLQRSLFILRRHRRRTQTNSPEERNVVVKIVCESVEYR